MLFRYVQRNAGADPTAAASLARELGVTQVTASVLIGRGVTSAEDGRRYFGAGVEYLRDPFGLADMDRAVERIRRAVDEGQRITVYGDYDVDGVCATTLMVSALREMGADVGYYIPSRHSEGYGVNAAAIQSLAGTQLLVTVDCGVTNGAELAQAWELGMDVVVTDHHECPDTLPDVLAVVNPKRPGQGYGFTGLCGAGVALKVVQALRGPREAVRFADLAALATVADIVPLADENLAIVRMGLALINAGQRPGIQALREVAGLSGKPVRSGHIGFALGPRINAGGRMDHSAKSVEMLLSADPAAATATAKELDGDNRQRMAVEDAILTEALAMIEADYDFARDRAIVLYQPHWNTGVTGIVASRIVERYHRPTLLFGRGGHGHDDPEGQPDVDGADDGPALLYGSGRSVPGVHLHRALKHCEALFARYGGHEQAAGCALAEDRLDALRRALNSHLRETYDDELFLPLRYYDAELTAEQLSRELAADLDALEPAGYGNPRPVFLLRGAACAGASRTADGKHLRLRLGAGGLEAIAFRQGDAAGWLAAQPSCDVLAVPEINEWQGRQRLQALVEHIRPPQSWQSCDAALRRAHPLPALPKQAEPVGGRDMEWDGALDFLTQEAQRSPFGALSLCFTRGSAQAVLAALGQAGTLERAHFAVGDAPQAARGENAVVLYPGTALPARRWARVFVFDGPLGMALAGQLKLDENSDIIKVNHPPQVCASLQREALLELYRRMRDTLAAGQPLELLEWRPQGEPNPCLAELAARVFCELGLLRQLDKSPWFAPGDRRGRADLNDSPTWRVLTASGYDPSADGGVESPVRTQGRNIGLPTGG